MRNLFSSKYMYLTAAMLAGAAMFTSCSNEDDMGNVNPTYDGESVKTQFAINIPAAGKADTRLGQNIVQGQDAPVFRGMDNIRLVPFTATNNLSGSTVLEYNPIILGAIATDGLQDAGNYKVYSDVDIPVGTQSFLFYGEAKEASDDEKVNGALVPSFEQSGWTKGAELSTLSFSLKQILADENATTTTEKTLTDMLNAIANTKGTESKAWSASSGTLLSYYNSYISMKAGSANNIRLALQDLYNTMKSATITNENELKEAICTNIETYFTVDPDPTTEPNAAPNYTLTYKETNPTGAITYPNSFGLPDGAVQLKYENGSFAYVTSVDYDGDATNTMNVASLEKYVYPASLYYWVATQIKTNTTSLTNGETYITDGTWSEILNQYTEGSIVTAATQSVALTEVIDYAVASLNLNVKFENGEIKDNGANWPTSDSPIGEKVVTFNDTSFPLTGILIGGQKAVGYDFKTTGTDEYTIFDSSIDAGVYVKQGTTSSAYSLALETIGKQTEQETVHFAIEMTNNSAEAFTGADGIVPVGGKFYLVGQLTSTDDHTKVFEQDHKTVANVTIKSLKNAYNCIPDLRSPKLELGLSVDLNWIAGLTQDVTID